MALPERRDYSLVGGRSPAEWDAMSLADLVVEWRAGRRGEARRDFDRLTTVRGEIFRRVGAPVSATHPKPRGS